MWTKMQRYWLGGMAMILLGMTFIVAAMGKLMAGSTAFSLFAFPSFVPESLGKAIYISLPYLELMIGGLLVLGVAIKFAVSLSTLLIIGFAVSNILLINLGVSECASCFGIAGSLTPIASLFLDGFMTILVLVTLFCYRGSFFNRTPWFLETVHKEREDEYVLSPFTKEY